MTTDLTGSFEFPGKYYEIIRTDFRNLEAETSFLNSYLPEQGSVLDLGCGTGTNLRALAAFGHRCVGVDQSARFIEYAQEHTDKIDYFHLSAAEFATDERFNLITCLFVTLNYLPPAEVPMMFDAVRSMLADTGRFVLDAAHLLNFVDSYQPYIIAHHIKDDVLITRFTRHEVQPHAANWRHEESILVRDGENILMYYNAFDQYVYTVTELRRLLAAAGLRVVEELGGFRRELPPRGRGHLILVAERDE